MLLAVPVVIVMLDEDREEEEKEGRVGESANEQGMSSKCIEYRLIEVPIVVQLTLY